MDVGVLRHPPKALAVEVEWDCEHHWKHANGKLDHVHCDESVRDSDVEDPVGERKAKDILEDCPDHHDLSRYWFVAIDSVSN